MYIAWCSQKKYKDKFEMPTMESITKTTTVNNRFLLYV
jgi:hypothetical protein